MGAIDLRGVAETADRDAVTVMHNASSNAAATPRGSRLGVGSSSSAVQIGKRPDNRCGATSVRADSNSETTEGLGNNNGGSNGATGLRVNNKFGATGVHATSNSAAIVNRAVSSNGAIEIHVASSSGAIVVHVRAVMTAAGATGIDRIQ